VAPLEFALPDVGEGIAQAEIVEWRVAQGERVREDQDLVEIQTDKAIAVIPCPTTGVVAKLCAAVGDTVPVGSVLAIFEPDGAGNGSVRSGEPVAETAELGAAAGPAGSVAAGPAPASVAPAAPPRGAKRALAAPATRRLARELGVALESVAGSGPHGRILREDVERAASGAPAAGARRVRDSAPSPAPAPGEVVPLRGTRRAIAHALTKAWLEVPRVIDYREVDATALMRARGRLRQRALDRGDDALAQAMTPTPLIVTAAVRALRHHPYVNSSIDLEREEITLHRRYDIGIATAAPDGLIVPVLHDAGSKTLSEIALGIAELAHAARERRLGAADLAGATFTVNNYGGLGVWLGTPIVRPPEVCNLGVGAVRDQVVAVEGVPVVRPTLALAVAADHRVLDGHTLAAFVTDVVELLEEPLLLLEDTR
jgi:pyruvate dehydrogenase E2 component (dihydrolipoamide acetyltransferase)